MKRILTTASLLGCVLFSSHASSVYINVGYGSSTIPSYYTTPRPFPSCAPTVAYGYSNHPVVTSGRCISIVQPAAPCVVTPRPPIVCAPTYIVPTSAVLDTTPLPNSSFNPSSTRNFEQLGGDWAHDLRQDIVTWDAFVDFLKQHVVSAFSSDRESFRIGFIRTYGVNAVSAWNKAWDDAVNL